ncbi:MAG: class II glutamine amidotransferase, partial [Actinomycetota bacterium]
MSNLSDSPHEECGVIAVSSTTDDVAQLTFFGLFALQHRGQEAAGIAVSDGRQARLHKDVGLVGQVFTQATLAPLIGNHSIGHTRYSTTGVSGARNAQPFLVETMNGPLAVAHNGNLVNAAELREELLARGFGLTASSDSEV